MLIKKEEEIMDKKVNDALHTLLNLSLKDKSFSTQKQQFKIVYDYITNLEQIRKEHSIMKQFIYENGLWEKFLNDDRFLEHLRSDDNE